MRHSLIAFAGVALAAGLTLAPAPVAAAEDPRCTELPQQVRSAIAGAESDLAAQATRRLRLGEQLCRAKNERGAAREFQVALKLLGAASGTASSAAGK